MGPAASGQLGRFSCATPGQAHPVATMAVVVYAPAGAEPFRFDSHGWAVGTQAGDHLDHAASRSRGCTRRQRAMIRSVSSGSGVVSHRPGVRMPPHTTRSRCGK